MIRSNNVWIIKISVEKENILSFQVKLKKKMKFLVDY